MSPKLASDLDWIDSGRLPPRSLVTGAMSRTVMPAAERDNEFVTHLAAERAGLAQRK